MTDFATDSDAEPTLDSNGLTRRRLMRAGVAGVAGLSALPFASERASAAASGRSTTTLMPGTQYETNVYTYDSGNPGPTTMVVGGMHGDELPGYRAAETIAGWSVANGRLVVLPHANAYAVDVGYRSGEWDLNRQFPPTGGECYVELARQIWSVVRSVDPDWVFDLHSSYDAYADGDGGGVGQAVFPTWTSPARACGDAAVIDLNDEFGLSGNDAFVMGNTIDADRPMLVHRVAGLLDRPGFIMEAADNVGDSVDERASWLVYLVDHVMRQYGQHRVAPHDARLVVVDDDWTAVGISSAYDRPICLAPTLSSWGERPAHVRFRNVSPGAVYARVEEWEHMDGHHTREATGLLAAESGRYATPAGPVQVGAVDTTTDWSTVVLDRDAYDREPVVLAQPQTYNGSDPVVARTRASTRAIDLRVQECEALGGYHTTERVGYLAAPQGVDQLFGTPAVAKIVAVDHRWKTVRFGRRFSNPVLLAHVQSHFGSNPCHVRFRNLGHGQVDLRVQEERSADAETGHVAEQVGLVVLEDTR